MGYVNAKGFDLEKFHRSSVDRRSSAFEEDRAVSNYCACSPANKLRRFLQLEGTY